MVEEAVVAEQDFVAKDEPPRSSTFLRTTTSDSQRIQPSEFERQ